MIDHVSSDATDFAATKAFYPAALTELVSAGGQDLGHPGLRPVYHPDYYGGFLTDPGGNNVEAVCHGPE